MNPIDRVQRWLSGRSSITPDEQALSKYIIASLEEAYPGKEGSPSGIPPHHNHMYRAAKELAKAVLK